MSSRIAKVGPQPENNTRGQRDEVKHSFFALAALITARDTFVIPEIEVHEPPQALSQFIDDAQTDPDHLYGP